ncbi:hypothetical protein [Nocardiopsis alba]|uniref:hypothetical protein n=1 Tax=Nocardiopsis alba TaxID=53437 RepID=UPI0003456830|nr:hypothetical protein [Nocardiopsis alba]
MEALIGTPLGEQAWREHREIALRLRRSYLLFCLGTGAFSGGAAAVAVALLGLVWQQGEGFPLAVLPFIMTPLILGPMWKRRTAGTVAPFLGRPRHVWPRWAFTLIFPIVLVLGVFVPWSPAWSIMSGVLCALPYCLSAVLEARHPLSPYPAVWSRA